MEEADVRREVYRSLQGYGYWPLHGRDAIICPTCKHKVLPAVAGRPDILVLNPTGVTKVMEVKVVDLEKSLSFSFNQIEEDQRRWLDAWTNAKGAAYITIGTVNEDPRRIWVIPWRSWLALEITQRKIDAEYVPVDLSLYKKLPNSKLVESLSALTNWCLIRVLGKKIEGDKFTGAHWEFQENHPIIKGRNKLWH